MTAAPPPPIPPPPAGLVVSALSVTVGTTTLLRDVDLVAPAGRWTTITGPSGSGKSVLISALGGLLPSTGSIVLGGRPARETTPGIVLQDYALLPLLTAEETVALPLQARGWLRPDIRAASRAALGALGLTAAADQLVSTLSGGQRQRVSIARALAARPDVYLLDEPTAELDAANRAVVLDLLRAEADRGAALVVVTYDPAILERSDRVLTLTPDGLLVDRAGGDEQGR